MRLNLVVGRRYLHTSLKDVPLARWKKVLTSHRPLDSSFSKIRGSIAGRSIRKKIAQCCDIDTLKDTARQWSSDTSVVGCVVQRLGELPKDHYKEINIGQLVMHILDHVDEVPGPLFSQAMSTLRRTKNASLGKELWSCMPVEVRSGDHGGATSMWCAHRTNDVEWADEIFAECQPNCSTKHYQQPYIMISANNNRWQYALENMTCQEIGSLLSISTYQNNPVGWEVLRLSRIRSFPFSTSDITAMLQFLIKQGTDMELQWAYELVIRYNTLLDARLLIYLSGIAALRYTQSPSDYWLGCYDRHVAELRNLPVNLSCLHWEVRKADNLHKLFTSIRYRRSNSVDKEGETSISILLGRPLPSESASSITLARLQAMNLR
eukprot:TRINITY_DN9656_c0_g1_i5.p1 TRINITY_DN9656_c0_g1~~TRINITY_DN9656_c0_g1_i5.p1  ORF type:complete len:378 (+),score=39.00 TRINITY_DN9656_c0_g1_i5:42-1175(+)